MLIDCDEIGVEYRVCSIGNGGLKQWGKFVNEDVQKCHIQIVELISGPTGRSNELLWIEFPKTLEHDEVFLSTFPKKERMIHMKTGRMNKFTLKDIFQPLLLEKLRLSPTLKVGALFKSILPHFQNIFQMPKKKPTNHTLQLLGDWLEVWGGSIDEHDRYKPPYNAIITTQTTQIWFGISPGFPQIIVFDSELEELSNPEPSALAVGLPFIFNGYSYNNDGRTVPMGIKSELPFYPRHPQVIKITNSCSEEEIREKLLDSENELVLKQRPIAIAKLKIEGKNPDYKSFKRLMNDVAKSIGADVEFEDSKYLTRNPNTYRHLEYWCLMFISEKPLSHFSDTKKTRWFKNFPVSQKKNTKFTFEWMRAARGRVHDLAHSAIIEDEINNKRNDGWIIIGDETGSGLEMLYSEDSEAGRTRSNLKKFSYIWVIVPPKVVLPATPSDFHAMDQRTYQKEHIEALQTLAHNSKVGLQSLIFETTNFVNESERFPRLVDEHVPRIIDATLPLVLQQISTQSKSTGKPVRISIMAERFGGEMTVGAPNIFVEGRVKKWISNLKDRGQFSNIDFKRDDFCIHPKLDHPWMNYPDAVGFLHGGSLPTKLIEYKQVLEDSTIITPLYLDFLSNKLPELLTQLAQTPYSFIENLFMIKVEHIQGYMVPYLSSMIEEALQKFQPMDWRKLNQLMKHKQSTNQGRIIAKEVSMWITPTKLSKILKSLKSDTDRFNLCLTLAWSMEQQGKDVNKYLQRIIENNWLKNVSNERKNSFISVWFGQLQNEFVLHREQLSTLFKFKAIKNPICHPKQLLETLRGKSKSTPTEMRLYGQIFSYLALTEFEDNADYETMWKCNNEFIKFEEWMPHEQRRHCIYGAELCLDNVKDNTKWYQRAQERLFTDFDKTLGYGESREKEQFWWPTAARYHTLCLENETVEINPLELNKFILRADQYTRNSNLIVQIRTSYWLLRLALVAKLDIHDDVLKNLLNMFKQLDEPKNVIGVLLTIHILDIHIRYNNHSSSEYENWFNSVLENSSDHTKSFFRNWIHNNPNSPLLDSLRFNYS